MHILVLNSGSSSIKFQLLDMPSGTLRASGLVERLGTPDSKISFRSSEVVFEQTRGLPSHKEGLGEIAKYLNDPKNAILGPGEEIKYRQWVTGWSMVVKPIPELSRLPGK